jgi:phage terminase large subunit-like protein
VYIPESVKHKGKFRTWAEAFVEQLCIFPNDDNMHDDYVDSFSQAMALLRDEGWIMIDAYEPPESYADDVRPEGNPYFA